MNGATRGAMLLLAPLLAGAARGAPPPPSARAGGPTIVSVDVVSDHGVLLDKETGWEDPATPAEKAVIAALGPEVVTAARGGRARPVSQTGGTVLRARVVVDVGPALAAVPDPVSLVGRSAQAALAMSSGPARAAGPRTLVFDVSAREKLPDRIALVAGEIQWALQAARGRTIACGRTTHTVFVTAGAPRAAVSWPVSGERGDPARIDHNAFTAARMQAAVEIAAGAASASAAAKKAWQAAIRHYDLSAERDVNPWQLLVPGVGAQCMTTASFIEAVVGMLGFSGGRFVDVYPSFRKPEDPRAVAYPHPLIRGAYTVESPEYEAPRQFRKVVAAVAPGAGEHSPAEAARHRGHRGFERIKFRAGDGGLHNYASAFVVDENGQRSYFGGGYGTIYHDAVSFLAGACAAVVWTWDAGDDDWDEICEHPGPGYAWATGQALSAPR